MAPYIYQNIILVNFKDQQHSFQTLEIDSVHSVNFVVFRVLNKGCSFLVERVGVYITVNGLLVFLSTPLGI